MRTLSARDRRRRVALMGAGVYIGATKPNTWNYVPFTPEPSGERAEPEEGAR